MKIFQKAGKRLNLSRFGRTAWIIAIMNGIGGIGWSTSFVYLSLYFYQERNIPMTQVGLIFLASGVSSAVSQIVGGITGDRYGYRKMVIIYSVAGLAAAAVQTALIGAKAPILSVILLSVLVPTLSNMANPSMNAIMANVSQNGRMTESYSLMAITGNIAWSIGPLLGGYLLGVTSFFWLFVTGTAIKSLALFGIPFLPADRGAGKMPGQSAGNAASLISNPTLFLFSLISILFFLTMAQWGGTLSVFSVDRIGFTTQEYGLLMSISGVIIVAFQYPISHRVTPANTRAVLVWACLFYGAGFLSLAWVRSFIPATGSIVIMVIGEMLFVPTALGVVGQISGPEDRGKSMGVYGLCQTTGWSAGPLLGGYLLDKYPASPLFLWGPISLCSFFAGLIFAVWPGYMRKINSRESKDI
jgi:MFS family permease